MSQDLSRRSFVSILSGLFAGAAASGPSRAPAEQPAEVPPVVGRGTATTAGTDPAGSTRSAGSTPTVGPSPALRVAFLTDTHLPAHRPDIAPRVAGLIDTLQTAPQRPDLVIFGGDNVMNVDAGGTTEESARAQFALWKSTVRDRLQLPSLSVIGNHDIFWGAPSGEDPKARAVETYGMPRRFYSHSLNGWRFMLLDCFHKPGCELDEEQWSWLEAELKAAALPTVIVSHAPILSATHFLEASTAKGHAYAVPAGWSPKGAIRFRELFRQHPQVKLALSGHMHTIDRVEIDHTTYICGGAVSGNWWGKTESYLGFDPAWIALDLFADGRWSRTVQTWT